MAQKKQHTASTEAYLSPLEWKLKKEIPPLQYADIVLVHTRDSLLRYLIRKVTKSYWDHTAIILHPKSKKLGTQYNIIIEAVDPNGIEVHKLDKYLNKPEKYDVGIRRVTSLTPAEQTRILSFVLLNVDAPYYKLSLWRFLLAAISKRYSETLLGRQRYCCSGFVQRAFYDALNWEVRDKVIFRDDFLSPIELQDITTPGDIARSTKAKWIFNTH